MTGNLKFYLLGKNYSIQRQTGTQRLEGDPVRFKTHFKRTRNLSLFIRFVEPCTVMSRAGSINPLLRSSVVSWSFCSELYYHLEPWYTRIHI